MKRTRRIITFITAFSFLLNYMYMPVFSEEVNELNSELPSPDDNSAFVSDDENDSETADGIEDNNEPVSGDEVNDKTVILIPEVVSCYYGQEFSGKVKVSCDESTVLPEGVSVPDYISVLNLKWDSNGKIETGEYDFEEISYSGYTFRVATELKFIISEYTPEESAYGTSPDDFYSEKQCVLKAPAGFLIGTDKTFFNDQTESTLTDTYGDSTGSIVYYLKNNDETSEYFGAVSEKKEYKYSCVSSIPVIESITFDRQDSGKPVNVVSDIGIIAGENIIVTLKARGCYRDIDSVCFNIYDESGKLVRKVGAVPGEDGYLEGSYTVVLPDNKNFTDESLNVSVVNEKGASEVMAVVPKEKAVNHIIIDKAKPEMTRFKIYYANEYDLRNIVDPNNEYNFGFGYFVADGILSEGETGIAKIEYKWDDDSSGYYEYNIDGNGGFQDLYFNGGKRRYYTGAKADEVLRNSKQAKKNFDLLVSEKSDNNRKNLHFRILVPFDSSFKTNDNLHTLHIRVTDYEGNVYVKDFKDEYSGGKDTMAPDLTSINVVSESEINILPSGNYANSSISFLVSGLDKSETDYVSGISSFYLNNNENENIISYFDETIPNGRYYLIIGDNQKLTGVGISVSDKGGFTYTGSISSELNKMFEKKDEKKGTDEEISVPSENLRKVKSDTFVVDSVRPYSAVNVSERTVEYEYTVTDDEGNRISKKDYWFNSDSQKYEFTFTDDLAGLFRVNMTRNGLSFDGSNIDYSTESESINEVTVTEKVKNLKTGTYVYSSEVTDNALNPSKSELFTVNIDKDAPETEISVISSDNSEVLIGDDHWVNSDDNFTISVNSTDDYAGVKKIRLTVKDENGKSFDVDFSGKNQYVYSESRELKKVISISRDELISQGVSMNSNHTYVFEYSSEDFAGNNSEIRTFALHVDTDKPEIDSVEVKKASVNGVEVNENIKVLPFGIFSNTSLTFKISASDAEFDSGVKEVRAYFMDEKGDLVTFADEDMIYIPEDDCYEFNVDHIKGYVFKKYMKLDVVDNYGKINTYYKEVRLTDGNEFDVVESSWDEDYDYSVNVIIEDKAPEMSVTLPEPDYTDKQNRIWFNEKQRNFSFDVKDSDSGLSRVSVSLFENENMRYLENDCKDEPEKLIVPEDVSSVLNKDYHYSFNTDIAYSEEKSFPDDGKYIFRFSSQDNSGNINVSPVVETPEYISIDDLVKDENGITVSNEDGTVKANQYTYFIDSTAPEIVKTAFEPVTVDGMAETSSFADEPEEFKIDDLHYGLFFKTDYDLKVYPEDSGASSGLKNVNYRLISYSDISSPVVSEEGSVEVNDDGFAVISVKKGFKGRIVLSAEDNVGNTSAEKYLDGFVSEDKAPEVSVLVEAETDKKDADGNNLYTGDVSVKVTVTDNDSGVKECRVRIDSEKTGENGREEIIKISDILSSENNTDGWNIEEKEANLVTKISKTFVFSSDDNNITVRANACDNSENELDDYVISSKFTIDKTAPVINVTYSGGIDGTDYYNKDSKATVTLDINERNFSESLIKNTIENSYGNNNATVEYSSSSPSQHRAVITFPEGDFTYSVSGSDLAGHDAEINDPAGGRKKFLVDETAPEVTTNFADFRNTNDSDLYFNDKQIVKVTVREHNFNQNDIGLSVMTKQSGSAHNEYDMNDNLYSFVKYSDWKTSETDKDLHTLEFVLDRDSVYQVVISPKDMAGNTSESEKTDVFEIDMTVPVVTEKNGQTVKGKSGEEELLDIYTEERKDSPNPSIKFDDINFDHLEYTLVKYVPDSKKNRELGKISPDIKTGTTESKEFILDSFNAEGTYYLEIKAVDKAGNSSVLNKNTYVKMIEKDVLAYIPDSSIENQSGLFSVEYENGEAISKRPDSFSDIDIVVMAKNKDDVRILLRDTNGDEKDTMLEPESEDVSMYGIGVYTYKLKREFFIENYQNDIDSELYLTVENSDERIDIAKIHIDNISPTCETDKKFRSWYWYMGNESEKIVITNISELLNESECKVYDKGELIPFEYSSEARTLSFTIDKGWHDIGVHIEDYAGNVYDIQQADNICVGNFWLWVILGGTAAAGGTAAFLVLRNRKRRN